MSFRPYVCSNFSQELILYTIFVQLLIQSMAFTVAHVFISRWCSRRNQIVKSALVYAKYRPYVLHICVMVKSVHHLASLLTCHFCVYTHVLANLRVTYQRYVYTRSGQLSVSPVTCHFCVYVYTFWSIICLTSHVPTSRLHTFWQIVRLTSDV